jgi:threonine/homoserine/homoserine lactone efflux protein
MDANAELRWQRVVRALAGFVAFAFVGTVSPGPNNTLLWASGMRFGFRQTLPHVVGTAVGMGALVVGVAAGIGAILDAVPTAETALKVVGSAYLLYVAYHVLRSGRVGASDVSHPLTLWQGLAFQWVNPKAWVFSIAAVGAFLPPTLPRPTGVALLCAILMVVVIGSSSAWAAGGAGLGQVVEDDRTRRVINVALAVLLVASVALIWV